MRDESCASTSPAGRSSMGFPGTKRFPAVFALTAAGVTSVVFGSLNAAQASQLPERFRRHRHSYHRHSGGLHIGGFLLVVIVILVLLCLAGWLYMKYRQRQREQVPPAQQTPYVGQQSQQFYPGAGMPQPGQYPQGTMPPGHPMPPQPGQAPMPPQPGAPQQQQFPPPQG